MYSINHFIEEDMINYDIVSTNKKYAWTNTFAYFITLYVIQKGYSEDHTVEREFESVANIAYIAQR